MTQKTKKSIMILLLLIISMQTSIALPSNTIFFESFDHFFAGWDYSSWGLWTGAPHAFYNKSAYSTNPNADSNFFIKNLSTVGYENINLTFYGKTTGTMQLNEYYNVSWYDGTEWIQIFSNRNFAWTEYSFNLSTASNNPNLRFNFSCDADGNAGEVCFLDNLTVTATNISKELNITSIKLVEDGFGLNFTGSLNFSSTIPLNYVNYTGVKPDGSIFNGNLHFISRNGLKEVWAFSELIDVAGTWYFNVTYSNGATTITNTDGLYTFEDTTFYIVDPYQNTYILDNYYFETQSYNINVNNTETIKFNISMNAPSVRNFTYTFNITPTSNVGANYTTNTQYNTTTFNNETIPFNNEITFTPMYLTTANTYEYNITIQRTTPGFQKTIGTLPIRITTTTPPPLAPLQTQQQNFLKSKKTR